MGRGLSDLQKSVLRLAARQRAAREKSRAHMDSWSVSVPDVWYWEALEECYGFVPSKRLHGMCQRFDRQAIGVRRYNAACAALSRALARLALRGLCVVAGNRAATEGVTLTDEGLRVAGV